MNTRNDYIANTIASRRTRSRRSVATLTLVSLIASLTSASAASVAAISGSDPPPTSDPPVGTTVPDTVEPVTSGAPVDTTAPASVTVPTVASPPLEPLPSVAPPPVVADVATVEVLEEIPVVVAAEDDFGASETDVWVFPSSSTYGDGIRLHAGVRDESACGVPASDCTTISFYIDGQWVGSDVLVPDPTSGGWSYASLDVTPGAGPHVVEVLYSSGSGSTSFTVAKAECTASFSQASERSTVGDMAQFVANITGPSQDGPPSGGTITIRDQNGNIVREVTKPSFADTYIGINTLPAGVHTLTFTYSGDENHNACSSSNSVTHSVYQPVDAVDDSFTAYQGNTTFLDVFANDTGYTAGMFVSVTRPQDGDAFLIHDGSGLTYIGDSSFTGVVTFTYTIGNELSGPGMSDTATVTVTVTEWPHLVDDFATTPVGTPVTIDVLTNDGVPGAVFQSVDAAGQVGQVTINQDQTLTYTPPDGFTGTDFFEYHTQKDGQSVGVGVVTITVTDEPTSSTSTTTTTTTTSTTVPGTPTTPSVPPTTSPVGNGTPVVGTDAYQVTAGQALLIGSPGVLANDVDPDGDPLTAELTADAAHGTLVLNADGSFAYTPDAGFVGGDSFTYTASDGQTPMAFGFAAAGRSRSPALVSEPVVVSITVSPAAPPVPAGTLPATR